MGLPTIMIVLAENQIAVADSLAKTGASRVLELNNSFMPQLTSSIAEICNTDTNLIRMSQAARTVVDGQGINAVVKKLGA
jgi:UDP-N-acetylglucosamine:LPS N-acetylglucosamine transferase